MLTGAHLLIQRQIFGRNEVVEEILSHGIDERTNLAKLVSFESLLVMLGNRFPASIEVWLGEMERRHDVLKAISRKNFSHFVLGIRGIESRTD